MGYLLRQPSAAAQPPQVPAAALPTDDQLARAKRHILQPSPFAPPPTRSRHHARVRHRDALTSLEAWVAEYAPTRPAPPLDTGAAHVSVWSSDDEEVAFSGALHQYDDDELRSAATPPAMQPDFSDSSYDAPCPARPAHHMEHRSGWPIACSTS